MLFNADSILTLHSTLRGIKFKYDLYENEINNYFNDHHNFTLLWWEKGKSK